MELMTLFLKFNEQGPQILLSTAVERKALFDKGKSHGILTKKNTEFRLFHSLSLAYPILLPLTPYRVL
jgi:hypothetical protein